MIPTRKEKLRRLPAAPCSKGERSLSGANDSKKQPDQLPPEWPPHLQDCTGNDFACLGRLLRRVRPLREKPAPRSLPGLPTGQPVLLPTRSYRQRSTRRPAHPYRQQLLLRFVEIPT